MIAFSSSPWLTHMTTIRTIVEETPGVKTYELRINNPKVSYTFLPGQFNMLYLPGIGETAISVSSEAGPAHPLRHTVRVVGNVTRAIARLQPGDTLGIRGPFGSSWPVEEYRGGDLVVVAGGLGLAPLRPAIYHLIRHRSDYRRVTLIYGSRAPADLLFAGEYSNWQNAGIELHLAVNFGSPEWQGEIGTVMPLLDRLQLDPARIGLFTCGPEVMMRFVAGAAIKRGVSASNVFVSLERNMNCAVGLCGHCQFGPHFVCKDGPVYPFEQVKSLMFVENF